MFLHVDVCFPMQTVPSLQHLPASPRPSTEFLLTQQVGTDFTLAEAEGGA